MAKKVEEGSKRKEAEEEGEHQAKRQRQGAPRQEENKPQPGGDVAEHESGDRKRKATEEVQLEERQASKAVAVEDEASGDENMRDLDAASVSTRGMVLNLREEKWDFRKR